MVPHSGLSSGKVSRLLLGSERMELYRKLDRKETISSCTHSVG